MMELDVHALRSEFNRNQSSCALKGCGRAQTITWNSSESRWPAAADSWKLLRCPVWWTEPGQVWRGLPCQGCLLPLLMIRGAGGCRGGWMQIGSLRGGVYVWSETKIITALLVTMSLALPLSLAWCFLPVPPSTFFSPTFLPPLFLSHYCVDKIHTIPPKVSSGQSSIHNSEAHSNALWFTFKDLSVGHVCSDLLVNMPAHC